MKKTFLYLFLFLVALSMILPFFIMFLISLSGQENIFTDYKNINLTFCAYKNVFKSIPVIKYFLNSLIVALFTTIGQVFISALAGAGISSEIIDGKLYIKDSNTAYISDMDDTLADKLKITNSANMNTNKKPSENFLLNLLWLKIAGIKNSAVIPQFFSQNHR